MKSYTVYECEFCGKVSRNQAEIAECEASHYGLTVDEMKEWHRLKELVKNKCYVVSVTKNAKTDKEADDAINVLLEFEKQHGIK